MLRKLVRLALHGFDRTMTIWQGYFFSAWSWLMYWWLSTKTDDNPPLLNYQLPSHQEIPIVILGPIKKSYLTQPITASFLFTQKFHWIVDIASEEDKSFPDVNNNSSSHPIPSDNKVGDVYQRHVYKEVDFHDSLGSTQPQTKPIDLVSTMVFQLLP